MNIGRAFQAREMRARGWSLNRIAWVLGISKTTVRRDLDDKVKAVESARSKERKKGYRGVCIDCGGPTSARIRTRGGGYCDRCDSCSRAKISAERHWTAEAIVDAIQRWAAAHDGKPPGARKWVKADPENDYPANGSVYRRSDRQGAPFASWADAIEAAGFPRPVPHLYSRTPEGEKRRLDAMRVSLERRRVKKEKLEAGPLGKLRVRNAVTELERRDIRIPPDVVRRTPPLETLRGDIDAHRLLQTFDCQAYGCLRDAESGEFFCRVHLDATRRGV